MLLRDELKFVRKLVVLQGDALVTIFLSFLSHARSNILRSNLYIYTPGERVLFYGVNSLHTSAIKELPPSACMSSGEDNQSWSYLVGAEVIDYAGERNIAPLRNRVIFEWRQKLRINLERRILAWNISEVIHFSFYLKEFFIDQQNKVIMSRSGVKKSTEH